MFFLSKLNVFIAKNKKNIFKTTSILVLIKSFFKKIGLFEAYLLFESFFKWLKDRIINFLSTKVDFSNLQAKFSYIGGVYNIKLTI